MLSKIQRLCRYNSFSCCYAFAHFFFFFFYFAWSLYSFPRSCRSVFGIIVPSFFPSLYAYVLLEPFGCQVYVVRTSPCKLRVCVVLFPSAPFPVCTRLFVMLVCFASQTTGLCSAFPFGSFPRLRTFVCYIGVLRLANFGFV